MTTSIIRFLDFKDLTQGPGFENFNNFIIFYKLI